MSIGVREKNHTANAVYRGFAVTCSYAGATCEQISPLVCRQRAPASTHVGAPVGECCIIAIVRACLVRVAARTPAEEVTVVVGLIDTEIVILVLSKLPCIFSNQLQVTLREIHLLSGADTELGVDGTVGGTCGYSRDALELVASGCGKGDVLTLIKRGKFIICI